MSTVPKTRLTAEQYLAIERAAQFRSEFFRGEMFAMVGASRKHNLIAVSVASELHRQFKDRKCEVYQSDMRVKVNATGLYTYPDVVATCDEPRFEDDHVDTLVNPKVIVEVLSPSTELWDRGKKFEHYRNIPSLRECVLISQDHVLVEKFAINADGEWALRDYRTLEDVLVLDSISCQIKLSDIYARIEFTESAEPEILDKPASDDKHET
ncbi:MAG TPA: Uma2 family endonuclease [Planctomycetaceae bacterium]|nr:Uma2 family endonuclease [Planctomycetaceae bacterium]HQZ66170.1 Uma2 family endonuclease [Planctomycetaceae bacterium]